LRTKYANKKYTRKSYPTKIQRKIQAEIMSYFIQNPDENIMV